MNEDALRDMRANARHFIERFGHPLELRDFDEQFQTAETDRDRARLCRAWNALYAPEEGRHARAARAIHAHV